MGTHSNRIKVLILFLIVLSAPGALRAADPLLDMLPSDSLFCVRINNLSGAMAKLDQYLIGVSPVGTAMMVNMQLAGIVGDPMLTGIEMNGTFAVVGLSDYTVGALIPLTNYAEFVKTNPNCTLADDGTALLSSPNSMMGGFAMTEAGGGKYAIVVPESEKGTLALLKTALTSKSTSLTSKLNAAQSKEAAAAPVWGYVNLAALYEQFSPKVKEAMESIQYNMPTEMGDMSELIGFYMQIYTEMFTEFAGSADSATFALTPEPTDLSLDISVRAKDGSELAQMLTVNPNIAKEFSYAGYLDNSNAVNAVVKFDPQSLQQMYDKIFDILEKSKPDAEMTEQIARFRDLTNKWIPAMGNEAAFSFSYTKGKPPFKFYEVIAVKDSKTVKELMDEGMDMAGDFYAAMGMPMDIQYKPGVSTYKNVSIDQIVLAFPPSDEPNDPMQDMMDQLYGGNLTYSVAYSPTAFYMLMGPESETEMKQLIDRKPAAAATGEVKAAFDILQKTSYTDFLCSVNIIKMMTGLGDMMETLGQVSPENGQPLPSDLFAGLDLPSESSLAIGGKCADGQAGIRLILPKQHLLEIMNAATQIQQKMMPPQMNGAPGEQEG